MDHLAIMTRLSTLDRSLVTQIITEQCCVPGDAARIIRSGRAAAPKGSLSDPTLLGRRGPGEITGEMALVDSLLEAGRVEAGDHETGRAFSFIRPLETGPQN